MAVEIVRENEPPAIKEKGEEISFLRTHLDNLRFYLFLLENSWFDDEKDPLKYIQNLKQEIEILRAFLNV